jgi:hypothetical protein
MQHTPLIRDWYPKYIMNSNNSVVKKKAKSPIKNEQKIQHFSNEGTLYLKGWYTPSNEISKRLQSEGI